MLRKMKDTDVPTVCNELTSLDESVKNVFHPFDFTMDSINNLLTLPYDHYFVCENDEGVIVGLCFLRTFGKYRIPTFGLVVWKRFRSMGYGRFMTKQVLDIAEKKLKYPSVKLKVHASNKVAYHLYIKSGFVVLYWDVDSWWMEKCFTNGGVV